MEIIAATPQESRNSRCMRFIGKRPIKAKPKCTQSYEQERSDAIAELKFDLSSSTVDDPSSKRSLSSIEAPPHLPGPSSSGRSRVSVLRSLGYTAIVVAARSIL